MCECFQVGGRFIAEDPDCPEHGYEASERAGERAEVIDRLREALPYASFGAPQLLGAAIGEAIRYLESL